MIRCARCHRRVNLAGVCEEHGLSTRPPSPELPSAPPAELAGWTQGACVAIGGSAHLFAAWDGERRAVVKWGRWRDAALHRRFEREARYLRRTGAPLVPALYAQGVAGGWPYLVLEQLDGVTLAGHLAARAGDVSRVGAAIARALAALHAAGVSHGDLKPENVFLCQGGVRLIDLGLAHAGDDDAIEPGGTVHYTAPEQVQGGAPLPASDVYALGAMLFEMLTGRPPFVGERPAIEYGHLMCRPPRPGDVAPGAAALDALITACLDKRPERRPALDAIIAALDGTTCVAAAPVAGDIAAPSREHGPVALLWIETRDRAEAARAIVDNQGRVLRERADGTLAAFLWLDHDRPAQVALAVGKRLALHGAIVLHTAIARVRRSSTRVTLHGPAIERPESWRPASPWNGLLVTGDAAVDLDEDLVATDPPGFLRAALDDQPARSQVATVPDLVARAELIDELARTLASALDDAAPLLVTLVGTAGAGKSRALDELQRILGLGHRVVRVGGRIGHAGRPTAGPDLAAALAMPDGEALAQRLRRAADGDAGLVVLVDDGHRAEDELLDLLELAAGWEGARLAVVVATAPSLVDARPRWGEHARAHHRFALRPLDDTAARRLVRQALAPARLVPEALIARIVEPAHGNPGALVAACRALHRRGLVRRYPGSDEWHVATDEVDLAALASGDRWSAARELAELPAGMRELVTLCAALGGGFDLAELEAVQHALPRGPVTVDAEAGLTWLRKQGLARNDGAGWSLADTALHDAALAHADDEQRAAIHRAAYAHWRDRPDRAADDDERLARLAHHGRFAGEHAAATAALLVLTRRAARRHAHVEAERTATLALELLAADDAARLRLLIERGRARFRIQRFEAAREDLAAAAALAIARGDVAGEVEATVADAAVLDFTNRLSDAAATIERALARAAAGVPDDVQARLDNWLGVTRVRQHRLDEAVALLERAIATADALGDHETAVGSMLMLASAHRSRGRLPLTLDVLGAAITRCESSGDAFHLTIALLNRINAWREAARFDAAEADCGRALALAEVHGFGMMEVFGWFNRSELRFLEGALDRALDDGRRAYAIARRRFRDEPPVYATLWLGVLEAGCGDLARARALHAEASPRHAEQNPMSRRLRAALGLATGASADTTWAELRAATTDPFDQRLFDWLSGSSTPASASAGTR